MSGGESMREDSYIIQSAGQWVPSGVTKLGNFSACYAVLRDGLLVYLSVDRFTSVPQYDPGFHFPNDQSYNINIRIAFENCVRTLQLLHSC